VLIVTGVTLDPNLSSEIEILIIASGISSPVENNKSIILDDCKDNYLDDGLAFIDAENVGSTEYDFTDIPAITRKLMANK